MNRWFTALKSRALAAHGLWTCLLVGSSILNVAHAQQNPEAQIRAFPVQAQRAVMVVVQPPELTINGKPDRLSPGARIRGANNMLVMSGAIVGQRLLVNFVREPGGQVHEVWILTEAEAAQKLPTPK